MTFASVNTWAYNDELTYTQMNTLNTNLTNAVDGLGGGTYTPTARIIVAGANGLQVSGRFEVSSVGIMSGGFITSGTVQFGAAVSITSGNTFTFASGSSLSVSGTTTLNGAIVINNTATYSNSATAPFFGGTVSLAAGANVANGATLTLVASSTLAVANTSSIAFSSGSSMTGATSLAAVCSASGSGRVVRRRVSVSDADHTYTIADGDVFHCTATLTANRIFRFDNTGAVAGDMIDISIVGSGGTANTVTIKDNGGTNTIVTMQNVTDSDPGPGVVPGIQRVTIIYTGSAWIMFDYSSRTN